MAARTKAKSLNVAVQGGGAHGAFAWGVLDYLLSDERIVLDGLCGTSAGSLNVVAVAYGLAIGGPQKAREILEDIWRKVSDAGKVFSPAKSPLTKFWKHDETAENALYFSMFETFTNAFSPYQFNPFNINPLREIVESTIDFQAVRNCDKAKLFITATDVYTGQAKVFQNEEMTADVVMASACLPFLYQAVTIHGRPYWDGGYVGNPSLWPLFYNTNTLDLCVIHINPMERHQTPKSAYEITNRINEISFNTSLLAELRSIAFVNKLIDQKWLKPDREDDLKNIRLHAIRADHELKNFSVASKFQTDWDFLTGLRDFGRHAAKHWLDKNYAAIGTKATIDVKDEFLSKFDDANAQGTELL